MSPSAYHALWLCYLRAEVSKTESLVILKTTKELHSKAKAFSLLFLILSSRQKFFRFIYSYPALAVPALKQYNPP